MLKSPQLLAPVPSSQLENETIRLVRPRQGDTVTLEIVDVYPGSKARNVAITQIILQGLTETTDS